MRFAICNEIFQGWTLEDTFRHCARLGYAAVELAPYTLAPTINDLDPAGRRRIRAAAAEAGIAIAGLHWVLVGTQGLHLTSPEPATRGRTADYLVALVDGCADLGGEVVILGSPKQRSLAPGVEAEQAVAWTQDVLRPAVRRAQDRGVVLCLEPLPAEDTNFLNTAAEVSALVDAVGSPSLQVILDVRAMSHEGRAIPDLIRATSRHLGHVHANDVNLKGPGFGQVDFVPIAAALRAAGYDRYVSVEVFRFEEGPEAIAERSLACLRQAFGAG